MTTVHPAKYTARPNKQATNTLTLVAPTPVLDPEYMSTELVQAWQAVSHVDYPVRDATLSYFFTSRFIASVPEKGRGGSARESTEFRQSVLRTLYLSKYVGWECAPLPMEKGLKAQQSTKLNH